MEAEWEYGCRAGSETKYWSGDGEAALAEVGWYGEDFDSGSTHPVGQKPANGFGLHEMHGNVWEWRHDGWDEATYRKRCDGEEAPSRAARAAEYTQGLESMLADARGRVFRGGLCFDHATGCRASLRLGYRGFRVSLARGPDFALRAMADGPAGGKQSDGPEKAKAAPGAAGAARENWRDARLPRKLE